MLQFVRCEGLVLKNITVRNSAGWTIHPVDCNRVHIHGISILNPINIKDVGPNTDGINPDGCLDIVLTNTALGLLGCIPGLGTVGAGITCLTAAASLTYIGMCVILCERMEVKNAHKLSYRS